MATCPTCHRPGWDQGSSTAPFFDAQQQRQAALMKAYPYLMCKKRCSVIGDAINPWGVRGWTPQVEIICRHCEHRWYIERPAEQGATT
jgi:hypothetical protein